MAITGQPPTEVLAHFDIDLIDDLGGSRNHQWVARQRGHQVVLRRYADQLFGDIDYELQVLQALHERGWPVPVPLALPVEHSARTWCLFEWLEGASLSTDDDVAKRARGRLLARLHDDLADLNALGQRKGCVMAHEIVEDPSLHEQLANYERFFPAEGRMMRWHVERARELFASLDLHQAIPLVLHSDFAPWNLLYTDAQLTGILDFEATHLNFAVADFALVWRGKHDSVIAGYQEVYTLNELDWSLLTPVFWSWLFLGVAENIRSMTTGRTEPRRLDWMINKLLLRSPLMGQESSPYTPE